MFPLVVWRMRDAGNIHGLSGIEKHYYTVYTQKKQSKPEVGLEVFTPIKQKGKIASYISSGKLTFDNDGWYVDGRGLDG